jgi:hypothetical protein
LSAEESGVDRLSLNVEDQLLVALEYWREYRSQFHISYELGLHETTVGRIVRKVENVLIKCGKFRHFSDLF